MDTLLKEKLVNCEVGAVFELYFITFAFAGKARFEVVSERTCKWEKNEPDTWVCSLSGKDKFYGGYRYIIKQLGCYYFDVGEERFKTITIYEDKTVTLWGVGSKTQEVLLIDPETEGAEEMVQKIKDAKALSVGMVAMLRDTYDPSCQVIEAKLTKFRNAMKSLEDDINEAEKELSSKVGCRDMRIRDANIAFGSVIETTKSEYEEKQRSNRQRVAGSDVQ